MWLAVTYIILVSLWAITLCWNMSKGRKWSIQSGHWIYLEENWLLIHDTVGVNLFCPNAFTLNGYFNFIQPVHQLCVDLMLFPKTYLCSLNYGMLQPTPALAVWTYNSSYFNYHLITIIIMLAVETGKIMLSVHSKQMTCCKSQRQLIRAHLIMCRGWAMFHPSCQLK